MSKAEKLIKDCERNCSNEIIVHTADGNSYTKSYEHWLTPDEARKAVEIAREEMIDWIEDNIGEYCYGNHLGFSAISIENIDLFDQESFIDDLRKAMKDE